jgi:hypothetical protein
VEGTSGAVGHLVSFAWRGGEGGPNGNTAEVVARLRPELPRRADPPKGGIAYRKVASVARFQAALVSASRHGVSESIESG